MQLDGYSDEKNKIRKFLEINFKKTEYFVRGNNHKDLNSFHNTSTLFYLLRLFV